MDVIILKPNRIFIQKLREVEITKFWERSDGICHSKIEDDNIQVGDKKIFSVTEEACYICGRECSNHPVAINSINLCDEIIMKTCIKCGEKYRELENIPKKYWYKPKTITYNVLCRCIEYGTDVINDIEVPNVRKENKIGFN